MNEIYFWVFFNLFVLGMLVLDLFVLNRKSHVMKVKEALWWSAFWVSLAMVFNVIVYFWKGPELALQFLTGYLIEESLSVDNLFVFILIFKYFQVPEAYQRKVLFWGIIGALVLRGIFIAVGVTIIAKFSAAIYILGAFLLYTGIKMAFSSDKEINPDKNPVIRFANRYLRTTKSYVGDKFFVKQGKVWYVTPLFIVVLVVETTDIVFAIDSIPAILGVTSDPFIVYTSNVFALLGLRSLFFALSGIMKLFHYLNYGLALILSFIGLKLMTEHFYPIDMTVALFIVAGILFGSVVLSILFPKEEEKPKEESKEEKKEIADEV
ncbi:TerC family protein [Cytophagaceae bacterium ABcell3]|nr:TerC family protein [Cytophagaceae bacterium ABcell3]